ncbi:MAG TPA: tetratricopeptide repeat protein [Gemmatimonadaceae bacterium]|nr:tetratricopeptide repeat protein [Gemmatimonadaceae bacterium]
MIPRAFPRAGGAVLAMLLIASAATGAAFHHGGRRGRAHPGSTTAFSERGERDVQIRVWNTALAADSVSAIALGQLAALHLQRAREGGGWNDYLEAEQYARRSVALRTNRNGSTAATLANVLLAQHRFAEAQQVAAQLVRREPDIAQYRALLGEASMEIGDYETAGRMFDSLWTERTHLTIAARLSRWAELHGNVELAKRLLDSARVAAIGRRDVPKETQAWYELRAGELAVRTGHPRNARRHFEAALRIEPNDPRVFAALARLALASGNSRDAIRWGDSAIVTMLDPEMLGVVGSAYAARGDTARASEYFAAMEAAVSTQQGVFHRAWMLQFLDRGVRVNEMLERARAEYATRKDIYGADVLAWALHCAGRDAEAEPYMMAALRLQTQDPLLRRHAETIAAAIARARVTTEN